MTAVAAPPSDLAPRYADSALADIPVPTGREEEWRFTPMARLSGMHELDSLPANLSFSLTNSEGLEVVEVEPARFAAADRTAAAAAQLTDTMLRIDIPGDRVLERPLVLTVNANSPQALGRVQVNVGAGSRGTLVVEQVGNTAQSLALEVNADADSSFQVIAVQDAMQAGTLLAAHHLRIASGASLAYKSATIGGGLVRVHTTVEYAGEGATAACAGAFFTADGAHHEHRLFVDHDRPHCTSDVVYKGAIQGDEAHSVWVGDVLIRAEAVGTKTYELNRNLLLTKGARADSVPNLEIETGEIVGAGHASATGRFDEEQLFYLMSRGIPENLARRLVVRGFLGEVIDAIEEPGLAGRIWSRVDDLLGVVVEEGDDD